MKIIITEEKSSSMLEKLHEIKGLVAEVAECFESSIEEMGMRSHREEEYPYEDEMGMRGNYGMRRREYERGGRMSFRGGRY